MILYSSFCLQHVTGEVLQQIGPMILLVSSCGILGFLSSAIIPIPALRAFVLQFAIILAVVTAVLLLLLPAVLSLDLRRRRSQRMDFFCCFTIQSHSQSSPHVPQPPHSSRLSSSSVCSSLNNHVKLNNDQVPAEKNIRQSSRNSGGNTSKKCFAHSVIDQEQMSHRKTDCTCFKFKSGTDEDTDETDCEEQTGSGLERQSLQRISGNSSSPKYQLTLNYLISKVYCKLLQKKPVKVVVILMFMMLFAVCLTGIPKVRDGLELTDIVPRGTVEHKFLDVQRKYFSFYHMFAVTEGNFEYPTNQKLLYEYHHSFTRIGKIIKNDDGGLPDFWLSTFRDWLLNLQAAYERDAASGLISPEGWHRNASDEGILAFKLLVQTGRNDYPIDKSLVSRDTASSLMHTE
jgi:patched 1 protein